MICCTACPPYLNNVFIIADSFLKSKPILHFSHSLKLRSEMPVVKYYMLLVPNPFGYIQIIWKPFLINFFPLKSFARLNIFILMNRVKG